MIVVIPARYASSRLLAKPLLKIDNKPIIEHTWHKAKCSNAKQIIIATDNQQIFEVCQEFGAEVCMTSHEHQSGTDRIAEVCQIYNFSDTECVVNLQGDEPLMPTRLLNQVADNLAKADDCVVATLATPMDKDLNNPNAVKVVFDKTQKALYFSRSLIPYQQNQQSDFVWHHHLGIYAYKVSFLKKYHKLAPSRLEQVESLEQLRVLWHGFNIHVGVIDQVPGIGIDTKADLEKVRQLLSDKKST